MPLPEMLRASSAPRWTGARCSWSAPIFRTISTMRRRRHATAQPPRPSSGSITRRLAPTTLAAFPHSMVHCARDKSAAGRSTASTCATQERPAETTAASSAMELGQSAPPSRRPPNKSETLGPRSLGPRSLKRPRLSVTPGKLHGHSFGMLRGPDHQRGLYVRHVGRRGQLMDDEILECAQVRCDAFQEEIDLARKHVTIAHDGRGARSFLEGNEIGLGLAVQPDHGEGCDVEAERLVIQDCGKAFDDAGLLQRADATEAWRRRDTHLAGELYIGDAPISLELVQDSPVGYIETGRTHLGCSLDHDMIAG